MCGIAGLFDRRGLAPGWGESLERMADSIRHRGPDDFGYFAGIPVSKGARGAQHVDTLRASTSAPRESICAPHAPNLPESVENERPWREPSETRLGGERAPRAAFAHRRLSILDLSEAARQPLVRAGGRVFLTYNGEIYNYRELRGELEKRGARFRTQSDSEVLLEAYLAWGIGCVPRLRGIFAFALADLEKGRVFLVRDHLGVKPLYVWRNAETWHFASEMKAFVGLPAFERRADPEALRKFLTFLWIPGEHTGLLGVRKLEPGSWLEVNLTTGEARHQRYWTPLRKIATETGAGESLAPDAKGSSSLSRNGRTSPGLSRNSRAASVEALREHLVRAVEEQLASDVPLGAYLSGGLDSSLVVALMSRARSRKGPVETYSVGYSAQDLAHDIVPDDLPYARRASAALGTHNHEFLLKPDVADLLPKVVWHLDEPLGDPAAISSFLIARAAKEKLTVMLSGMGGDELFAGYPRQKALQIGRFFRHLPHPARKAARLLGEQLPGAGTGFAAKLGRSAQKFLAHAEGSAFSHYVGMETYFDAEAQEALLEPGGALARVRNPVIDEYARLERETEEASGGDPLRQALLLDLVTYLPCLNLAYTDKTSMAHGIEARVPLLDIELVEWSLARPAGELIAFAGGKLEGKWLLKKAAEPWVPSEIIWRKKAGFGSPVRSWLKNDLAEMRGELLTGLGRRGWIRESEIRRLEADFLSGRRDYSLQLWMLLSLELWARAYLEGKPA